MKFIIIPYIALGFVLSSAIGIGYSCHGIEIFPEYYASPFIFKQKSLGSSLTYYFSVSGIIMNAAIWSIIIVLIRRAIVFLIERKRDNSSIKKIYKVVVIVLIVFTTLNIVIDYIMLGNGFEKGLNYWYIDIDKEAKDQNVECIRKLMFFEK